MAQRWSDEIQAKAAPTVWNSGGCSSWYLDEAGRNTTLWPDYTYRFVRRVRAVSPEDYHFSPRISSPHGDTALTDAATATSLRS